jgi:phosphoribosylglycinamide formyltransferase 1
MSKRLKIAILVSGNQNILLNLIKACNNNLIEAEIGCIISDEENCPTLGIGIDQNIIYKLIPNSYKSTEFFENELDGLLQKHKIDLVCFADFKTIISQWLIDKWYDRMISSHLSLLPKYKGADAPKRALEANDEETGCTIHYVRLECDGGPMLVQRKEKILANDDVSSLTKRLREIELSCYIEAINKHCYSKD